MMGSQQKVPLRALTKQEEEALRERARASNERVDVARRAQALLAVAQGCSFTKAGKRSGMSREGVSQLVERFNQRGLAVLLIAAGRERKAIYTSEHHERILQEVQRAPNRQADQTATWSLSLLKKSLRARGLSRVCQEAPQASLPPEEERPRCGTMADMARTSARLFASSFAYRVGAGQSGRTSLPGMGRMVL